jgi:hypothetical protein
MNKQEWWVKCKAPEERNKLGRFVKGCKNPNCVYPRKNARGTILLKPKSFQWANISKKYLRDFSDWMQLCASCHAKYDRGLINI